MNRSVIAVLMLATLTALACAKAPIIKRTAPGYFMGFHPLKEGEGRILVYRGAKLVADGGRVSVAVEDCRFEIGIRQFAVCTADPGMATVEYLNMFEGIEIADGLWTCATVEVSRGRKILYVADCRDLMTELGVHRQVWTTQLPRESILEKEIIGRDRQNRARRGYPKGD